MCARVTGPLMSVDASGKLADSIVFSRWRGRKYVRQWTKPANPNTAGQQTQRGYMTTAIRSWVTEIGSLCQQAWRDFQAGQSLSGPNEYVSRYMMALINSLDVIAMSEPVATPGVDQVTVTWYSALSCTGRVHYGTSHRVYSASQDEAAPGTSHSVVITGLVTGVKYYFFIDCDAPETTWQQGGEISATPT